MGGLCGTSHGTTELKGDVQSSLGVGNWQLNVKEYFYPSIKSPITIPFPIKTRAFLREEVIMAVISETC